MEIKVSIIIPVFNVAAYLETCLSSCVNQTFRDIEIIVVNDGSTDESPLIIQKYAEKDDRIKVITKENEGLIYARKSGLDIAQGEYVFHLDGDDYIEIDAIDELYSKAVNSGADYVIGHFYSVRDKKKYEERIYYDLDGLSGQDFLLKMLDAKWNIWGRLIHISLFDNLIYYPVFSGEDLFLNMQIALNVKKTVVVDLCLYNYVTRPGSVTQIKEKNIYFELDIVKVKSILYLLDIYNYNKQIREVVHLMFITFYVDCMIWKRMEIKPILYDYYWSKKEIMSFLWKNRKKYYLVLNIFFRLPLIVSPLLKLYYSMMKKQ